MRQIIIDSGVLSRVSGLVICGLIIKKYERERNLPANTQVVPGDGRYVNVRFNFNFDPYPAPTGCEVGAHIVIGQYGTLMSPQSASCILDGHAFGLNVVNEDAYKQQVIDVLTMLLPTYVKDQVSGMNGTALTEMVACVIEELLTLDHGTLVGGVRLSGGLGVWSGVFDDVVPDTDTLLGAVITRILLKNETEEIALRYIRSTGAIHVDAGYSATLDARIRTCRPIPPAWNDQITAIIYGSHPQTNGACVITFDPAFAEKFAKDITPGKIGQVISATNSCDRHPIRPIRLDAGGSGFRQVGSEFEVTGLGNMLTIRGTFDPDVYSTLVNYFDSLETTEE